MNERLEKLRAEFARGQEKLSQLEAEAAQLRQTMLRISGAIQVLEEELGAEASDAAGDG
jgi:predicted nuclease with TOPRIM domain